MAWFLQTPVSTSPKLLTNILAKCGPAVKGGAAFAFASANGVKLLAAEGAFDTFLKASKFVAVIGLDAITDTNALEELRKLQMKRPNFKPKLFLHSTVGSLFHPKTLWLKAKDGSGVIITGSGNLTPGGLKSNWEALAVETLSPGDMAAAEKSWDSWLTIHKSELLDINDERVIAKAKANKIVKSKVQKIVKTQEGEQEDAEAEVIQEVEQELQLNPVLIAEIPKASTRWEQANFDKKSYIEFFGVNMKSPKSVQFFNVQADGSLKAEKTRPPVTVKSRNFRFEVGAAKGIPYPVKGVPIAVFERISDTDFKYILLLPSNPNHKRFANFLDHTYPKKSKNLRRVQITAGDLQKIWPAAPFFL
ncbi:MAG: phospholipase D family protein [Alphaproteobacteria bacterium]